MQKWEYCAIKTDAGLKYFRAEGGHTIEKYEEKNIDVVHRSIAQLGSDGWELVSHSTLPDGSGVYYFKRPQSR